MAKANKSNPFSIRVDLEKFGFVKYREKLESGQQVVDFLLNKYWWEHKMPHVTPKEAPPIDMKVSAQPIPAVFDAPKVTPINDEPLSFDALKSQINPVSDENWYQKMDAAKTLQELEAVGAQIKRAGLGWKEKNALQQYGQKIAQSKFYD